MRLLSEITYRVRALFARARMDDELGEELRDHLAREIEANRRRGMSPDAARHAAAALFGGETRFAEEVRDARGWRWIIDARYDLRHALRLLRRYRGFALSTILITALGVGSTTVVFSAVNGVLLRPLPFPRADQVARLTLISGADGRFVDPGQALYPAMASDRSVFAGVGAYTVGSAVLLSGGEPELTRIEYITPSLLALLRVHPLLGRLLADDDSNAGARVVLLSHHLWVRLFGSDTTVLGRSLTLDGVAHIVVGVMPPTFSGPMLDGRDVWSPIGVTENGARIDGRPRPVTVIARIKDGVTRARAESWLDVQLPRIPPPADAQGASVRASLSPILSQIVDSAERPLWILLGAVAAVLVLVAANVATLVLARSLTRDREMAVRRALGASRARHVRQLLVETLMLAFLGGALGVVLARIGLAIMIRQGVAILPRISEIVLDWRVLLCASGATLVTGLVAALGPVLSASDVQLVGTIKGSPSASGFARRHGRTRDVLVVAEVAISVLLLIGAGLLMKGFLRVAPKAPGYATANRAAVQVRARPAVQGATLSPDEMIAFMQRVRRGMELVAGVRAIAVTPFAPLVRSTIYVPVTPLIDAAPAQATDSRINGHLRTVSTNFFDVMEIPVVAGRMFDARDDRGGAAVAIVNETAAARWWPGRNPIGRQLQYAWRGGPTTTVEIVGVSHDVRFDGTFTASRPEFFVPFEQRPSDIMTFVVHTDGDPRRLVPALKRAVWAVDARLPITLVATLDEIAGDSVKQQRFYAALMGLFAAIALVLASAGIFSVLAYVVSQRTREIGIRMALGAPRWNVGGLVVRQGLFVAAAGIVIGAVLARLLTRFLQDLLLEVTPTDPGVFVLTILLMCVVALAACSLPLYRALSVDPVRTLRE